MKQHQSSNTAEGIALIRAIESSRPAARRICDDPLARSLVSGFQYMLSKLMIDSGLYAWFTPGAIEFITGRERYIDDFLSARLAEGLDQVVLLGAGFDTRAYRIAGIERTRVFEVDHPDTQALKRKRLKQVLDPLPGHVTFVAVDFNTQELAERLLASGYDERAQTLFIWQGVCMYLTPEGVDRTLAVVARHSAPGSTLIFDYFTTMGLRSPLLHKIGWLLRLLGEELHFGIAEGQLEAFLSARGFRDVHDADPEELRQRYFTGPNAGRAPAIGVNIASARVGGAA